MKTVRFRKVRLAAAIALLWGAGAWIAFLVQEPSPEDLYSEWLATRHSPSDVGFLERLALRFGISAYSEMRKRADLEVTSALLKEDEYALAVASWVDSASSIPRGQLNTWQPLRIALTNQLKKDDPNGLNQMLARSDVAGFAEWKFAITKSAHNNGTPNEIDGLIQDLKGFEVRAGLDPKLSDDLERYVRLYDLSEADLGRVILGEEGLSAASEAEVVAKDRGVGVEEAASALWGEWRSEGLARNDWDLGIELSRRLGITSRTDYLVWLSLDPGSQAWRSAHRAEFSKFLESECRSNQNFGCEFVTRMFREMAKESEVLSNDWEQIAGMLLTWIERESDLSVWINDTAGLDFIWICHTLNSERLLDRAVRRWVGLIDYPHRWIAEFIEEGHYGAVCAVIEGSGKEISYIGGRPRPEPPDCQKPSGSVDAARELADKVAAHSPHEQVKGFIELLVGERVLEGLPEGAEREAARLMVNGAISRLNDSETINPALVPQVVNLLSSMEPEFFVVGKPCFERWRNGLTLDGVASAIQAGTWMPDPLEREIWMECAATHLRLKESPGLLRIIEELVSEENGKAESDDSMERFQDFLKARWPWVNDGTPELGLVQWGASKLIADHEPEKSARWMFDQLRIYLELHPDHDEARVLERLYDGVSEALRLVPVDQSIQWLETVLDEKVSNDLPWPEIPWQIFGSESYLRAEDFPEVMQKTFGDHRLRTWIAREILLKTQLGFSLEEQQQTLLRMRDSEGSEPWLRSMINGRLEKTFDFNQFEKDMVGAPAGARRYFLKRVIGQSRDSFSISRSLPWKHSEEDGVRMWLWMGEQTLDVFERGQELSASELNMVFEGLLSVAEHRLAEDRFQRILTRLRGMELDPSLSRSGQSGRGALADWRERTAALAEGGVSDAENLLTNDLLPTTERVWGLVVKGRGEDARLLMIDNGDDLTFEGVPRMGAPDFSADYVRGFPSMLKEEPELRLYAELYLGLYGSPSIVQRTRSGAKPWPASAGFIAKLEEPMAEYARRFEVTEFDNKELERKVFYVLRRVHGLGPLMKRKVAAFKASRSGGDGIEEEVGLANLEIRLTDSACEDYRDFLPELESITKSASSVPEGWETMRYHFWRKAVFNEPFLPHEREILGILAFEKNPSKAMLHSPRTYHAGFSESGSVMKMQVVHFALCLAESRPDSGAAWRWGDFPMASDERYQINASDSADFTGRLTTVLAARCRDWDEESRWKLMELLQTDVPGFRRKMENRTISTFLNAGFVKVEGGTERLRDFVRKYPQNGWSYQAVIAFGQDIGDDSLVKFGWDGVGPFVAGNPDLAKILERTRMRAQSPR